MIAGASSAPPAAIGKATVMTWAEEASYNPWRSTGFGKLRVSAGSRLRL